MIPRLMETNVYTPKGRVLLVGSCLPEVWPEAYEALAREADQVYSLCLETTHVNMAITKLSAILSTGRLRRLTLASVDRSPHCTQMHYMKHEIERTLQEHAPMESFVISEGRIVKVPGEAVALSKNLAKLAQLSE